MPISVVEAPLKRAQQLGLVEWRLHEIVPTERGRNYLNELLQLFMSEEDE